jgi:signal transduction histidine kinase
VDNVLINALEHSPSEASIRIRVGRREEGVELAVTDQGPGIPEESREKIFEKFGRLDMRKDGLSANRGLGLTFCRLAVEAHGGVIWVEDGEQGGASFRMILPAIEPGRQDGGLYAVSA